MTPLSPLSHDQSNPENIGSGAVPSAVSLHLAAGTEPERRDGEALTGPGPNAGCTREIPQGRMPEEIRTTEAELREFLEKAAVGMQWLSPDGTVVWANCTLLALLAWKQEQFVGRNFAEFIHDPGESADLLARLGAGKVFRGCELRIRCGDGSSRWVRIDANPWSSDGQFLHARCFVLDVTEKKRADEAQMRLAAIVASSDDAIASKDLNGIVTSWNAAAERILGYNADEIIGKSVLTIIPPELHGDEPEILRKIQAGERIEHFETVRVTKAGERIDVSLTVSPVRDQQGRIIGAAKILRNITEQKKLEAALRTTERLASVGRLAATVAHEINNPLEAVTNLLYLACQDPNLPESARARLNSADEELKRVSHIARQTLGFYRDTSSPHTIPVAQAIDEVLALYARRFQYKEISVRTAIPEALAVRTLEGEFKQIVSNLVSNAIEASPRHTLLRIRAWRAHHPATGVPGIRVVVADEGSGIPASIRKKVFSPFFTTKKDVGTGLGLWIVRDLLMRKGGSIRCRSRVASPDSPRSGTVMMVFLASEEPVAFADRAAA